MISYELSTPNGQVTVSLQSLSLHKSSPIEYDGTTEAIALVRDWLEWEYGAYGHFIGTATTPIDLAVAMGSDRAKTFVPKLITGAELLEAVDLGLPDDAMT